MAEQNDLDLLCVLEAQGKDGELQKAAQDPIANDRMTKCDFGFMGEGGYDISPLGSRGRPCNT